VNSDINLFEAYSEMWAKIMNTVFCSYNNLSNKNKNNSNEFLKNYMFFINIERLFCYFQMVKVLDFMGLKYTDLYKKDMRLNNIRETFYKEKTNVLSYYIITLILLNNLNDFLHWCSKNNSRLLQFEKISGKQEEFCISLIETKYKSPVFLKNIKCIEEFLHNMKQKSSEKDKNERKYILNNLRMTTCELG
jgi:hypothetical protein